MFVAEQLTKQRRYAWHARFDELVSLVGPARTYATPANKLLLLPLRSFDLCHDWLYDTAKVKPPTLDSCSGSQEAHQADYGVAVLDLPRRRWQRV